LIPDGEDDRLPDAVSAHQNGHRKGFWSRLFGGNSVEHARTLAYRRIAMQLHLDLGEGAGGRAVMLAPPVPAADLGARVSLELGHFLAKEFGREVLVIDACFGRPWAAGYLGQPGAPGLLDWLEQTPDSLGGFLLPTDHEHVSVMPAGTSVGRRAALLESEALKQLVARARLEFDYVLISCPPVLEDSTGLVFAPFVDVALLLAVEHDTRIRDLDAAQRALLSAKASRLGLVLTQARRGRDLKLR
jgi:Mrp family chromosome partitioning ATPase